jgi:hypothetical protein
MSDRVERKCHGLTWEAQDTPQVRVWETQTSLPAYVVEYRDTGGFLGGGVLEPTFEDACASEIESKLRTARRIIDAFSSYERTEEHD